jgi:hypothetical protein
MSLSSFQITGATVIFLWRDAIVTHQPRVINRLPEPDEEVKDVGIIVDDSTRRHKCIKGRLCL